MSFGRYELFINGEKAGDHETIQDVFHVIDSHYEALDDQYAGVVRWEIEDHDIDCIRITRQRMEAGFWYAYAETPEAFKMWLDLFGWSERSARYVPDSCD